MNRLRTREGTRQLLTEDRRDGQYQEDTADREKRAVDVVSSLTESAVGTALRGGKKLAQQVAQKHEANRAAEQAEDVASGRGTAAAGANDPPFDQTPPYKNQTPTPGQRTKTAAAQRAEPIRPNLPDVHQSRLRHDSLYRFKVTTHRKPQPRQASAPKTATTAVGKIADTNKARKTAANAARRAKQAEEAAREATQKLADAVMAGLKALWASTQTLVAAIAAGGTAAVIIIVIICMIALVLGSAFGIFFAGESTGTVITIQEVIIQLNGEYQDRLEEIENNITHDRQEIVSNDGSYAIAWQDVLAVFAARTSGAEDGAPVAVIDEENLDRLRHNRREVVTVVKAENRWHFTPLIQRPSDQNGQRSQVEFVKFCCVQTVLMCIRGWTKPCILQMHFTCHFCRIVESHPGSIEHRSRGHRRPAGLKQRMRLSTVGELQQLLIGSSLAEESIG